MKFRNVVQAIWPGLWLTHFTLGISVKGDTSVLFQAAAALIWFGCALLLHPCRKWSWWACFVPAAAFSIIGIVFLGGLIHLMIFPENWPDSNRPGALLIPGGLLFLVPSIPLLAHLLVIRRQFYKAKVT